MKHIKLASGADLGVGLAPLAEGKALFKAVCAEFKDIEIKGSDDINYNFIKNVFCSGFSSDRIEECTMACLKRCTYNGLKITEDTFEPEKAREDYIDVFINVISENIAPFLKGLSAELSPQLGAMITSFRK